MMADEKLKENALENIHVYTHTCVVMPTIPLLQSLFVQLVLQVLANSVHVPVGQW